MNLASGRATRAVLVRPARPRRRRSRRRGTRRCRASGSSRSVIEIDGALGIARSRSRAPQYLTNAMLDGASTLAFTIDSTRSPSAPSRTASSDSGAISPSTPQRRGVGMIDHEAAGAGPGERSGARDLGGAAARLDAAHQLADRGRHHAGALQTALRVVHGRGERRPGRFAISASRSRRVAASSRSSRRSNAAGSASRSCRTAATTSPVAWAGVPVSSTRSSARSGEPAGSASKRSARLRALDPLHAAAQDDRAVDARRRAVLAAFGLEHQRLDALSRSAGRPSRRNAAAINAAAAAAELPMPLPTGRRGLDAQRPSRLDALAEGEQRLAQRHLRQMRRVLSRAARGSAGGEGSAAKACQRSRARSA